jgi:hypothetical protein
MAHSDGTVSHAEPEAHDCVGGGRTVASSHCVLLSSLAAYTCHSRRVPPSSAKGARSRHWRAEKPASGGGAGGGSGGSVDMDDIAPAHALAFLRGSTTQLPFIAEFEGRSSLLAQLPFFLMFCRYMRNECDVWPHTARRPTPHKSPSREHQAAAAREAAGREAAVFLDEKPHDEHVRSRLPTVYASQVVRDVERSARMRAPSRLAQRRGTAFSAFSGTRSLPILPPRRPSTHGFGHAFGRTLPTKPTSFRPQHRAPPASSEAAHSTADDHSLPPTVMPSSDEQAPDAPPAAAVRPSVDWASAVDRGVHASRPKYSMSASSKALLRAHKARAQHEHAQPVLLEARADGHANEIADEIADEIDAQFEAQEADSMPEWLLPDPHWRRMPPAIVAIAARYEAVHDEARAAAPPLAPLSLSPSRSLSLSPLLSISHAHLCHPSLVDHARRLASPHLLPSPPPLVSARRHHRRRPRRPRARRVPPSLHPLPHRPPRHPHSPIRSSAAATA